MAFHDVAHRQNLNFKEEKKRAEVASAASTHSDSGEGNAIVGAKHARGHDQRSGGGGDGGGF